MGYVRIWRFEAAPGREQEFATAYGPAGDWVRLFRQSSGYRNTEIVQPIAEERVFLVTDRWASREAWDKFLQANHDAYSALDHKFAALCAKEIELDEYEVP